MRKQIFAANWKMYKTVSETKRFFAELKALPALFSTDPGRYGKREIIVFPPAVFIQAAVEAATGADIKIGAQNVYWEEEGAFTGELSAPMLRDAGAAYCLCGHSERRRLFDESDEIVARKAAAAVAAGLIPLVCVGETLLQRENMETNKILQNQLSVSLAGIQKTSQIVIAYEPVWAIGTGVAAGPADAQAAVAFIRRTMRELRGDAADETAILYGGSVKAQNIKEIMRGADIDGVLVGAAGLQADSFAGIIGYRS